MREPKRPVLATVIPVKVRVVVAPMAHAPPATVSWRVFAFAPVRIAPVMRAEPIIWALGAPVKGIFVKTMLSWPPAGMVPAVELNPMRRVWHVELSWHDDMGTMDVTWYPEMGPLGPLPAASTVTPFAAVAIWMPVSLPAVCAPRVRPLIVTV